MFLDAAVIVVGVPQRPRQAFSGTVGEADHAFQLVDRGPEEIGAEIAADQGRRGEACIDVAHRLDHRAAARPSVAQRSRRSGHGADDAFVIGDGGGLAQRVDPRGLDVSGRNAVERVREAALERAADLGRRRSPRNGARGT